MADVELLPLPWTLCHFHDDTQEAIRAYARANVEHHTAPLLAENERLRAEVAEWKRVASAQAELHGEAEARAERLAEVLREAADDLEREIDAKIVVAQLRATMDQEEGHE